MDSGAEIHCSREGESFSDFVSTHIPLVQAGETDALAALGSGTCRNIPDVLFVPQLSFM